MDGEEMVEDYMRLRFRIPFFLKILVVTGLLGVLYYPQLTFMANAWLTQKEFSHGVLIPLISGFIAWTKRDQLRALAATPDFRGFYLLLLGMALLIAGYLAFEDFTKRFSLIVTLFGLVLFLLGYDMLKLLSFPLGYLIFMVPPPHFVIKNTAVGLKLFSAKITYVILNGLGMPIVLQDVSLQLPNITCVVADFCTGTLSLIAVSALAVLYAYVSLNTFRNRVILIALAIPAAIVSNVFRLVVTVGLAYYFGEKALSSFIHEFYGTVNFLITVVLLILIGRVLKKAESGTSAATGL
jgi:exosortase